MSRPKRRSSLLRPGQLWHLRACHALRTPIIFLLIAPKKSMRHLYWDILMTDVDGNARRVSYSNVVVRSWPEDPNYELIA